MKEWCSRREMVRRLVPEGGAVAEVGVFEGDFAAELLMLPIGRLCLIDAWDAKILNPKDPWSKEQEAVDAMYDRVCARFWNERESGRVAIDCGESSEIAASMASIGEMFDLVYLDADHRLEAVLADLRAWSALVKPGGYLCGHDYRDDEVTRAYDFGVVEAVTRFCAEGAWELVGLTTEPWASFALRRKYD